MSCEPGALLAVTARAPAAERDQGMLLIGKLHPLLLHFPIGLVLGAAAAELLAILTQRAAWRAAAIANVRAGAAMAALTAIAGWGLTSAPFVESSRLLEWHRWMGVAGAVAAIGAAMASARLDGRSPRTVSVYRAALFTAAALIGVAGHLGGTLVWGVDFLRP
jgi:uncharacterized membrane protein